MSAMSKKDVAKSVKTLIVMLQSLRDQQVTIVLRNDSIVRGTVIKVDASMNVELRDATVDLDPFYQTDPVGQGLINSCSIDSLVDTVDIGLASGDIDSPIDNVSGHLSGLSNKHGNLESESELRLDSDEEDVSSDIGDDYSINNQGSSLQGDKPIGKRIFDYFVVKGTRIRYIDLPNDRDMVASTKAEIERIRDRSKQWSKHDIIRPTTSTLIL